MVVLLRLLHILIDNLTQIISGIKNGSTVYEKDIAYDPMGNIKTLNRNGTGVQNYAYSGNRLSTVTGGVSRSYTYDANGNVLTDGTNTFVYNVLNLPATVTGVNAATYTYDAIGSKLTRVAGGATTHYVDGIQYAGSTIDFIQTEEGIARRNTATDYLYNYNLTDHLGNSRFTFNGAGSKLQSDDYYPFGMTFNSFVSGNRNNYLYNGKELQLGLGQYDYGARFYDPVIGRWNVIDPLAEMSRRFSPYTFVYNNPLRFVDPDGMMPKQTSGDDWRINEAEIMSKNIDDNLALQSFYFGDKNDDDKRKGHHPVPPKYKKEGLPGFPGSKPLPNQKGARPAWDLGRTNPGGDEDRKIPKGWWGEWDSKRPEIEVYDKQGKHQGAYDPETGKLRPKSEEPNRKPTYDRFNSEEPDAGRSIIQKGFEFPQITPPPPGTAARTGAMATTLMILALILALAGG